MYIYNVGDADRGKISGPVLCPPTDLELRYEGTLNGYMCRIPPTEGDVNVTLDASKGIGITVFYRTPDQTIVPTYDVMSRGFAATPSGTLTTFAGPMNFSYSMSPDRFVVTRNFEYLPDYQFAFDDAEFDEPGTEPPSIIKDPVSINKYTEAMYETVKRAGVTEPQSFIYRGLNEICPIVTLAYLEPDALPQWIFEESLDRMYARRGMTESEFVSLLFDSNPDPIELKQVVIEAVDLINTLAYRNDVVFGRETDVHQNIRLTNRGDCEDGGQAMYLLMKHVKGERFRREAKRRDTQALGEFFSKNITPMMMHMRIDYAKSNSHSIASGVVFVADNVPDRRYQMFLMEGTGPEHASFCSIADSRCDPEESAWRRGLARKISKDSPLQYYREPCDGQWKGDSFYKGFIGAVVDEDYRYFLAGDGDIKNDGVGLCEVAMEGEYTLKSAVEGGPSEAAKAEMRRLATFTPPLPEPGADGSFPSRYNSYLQRVKEKIKPRVTKKRAFTMFLNLCITEKEFECALRDLEGMEGEVKGYSTFPGTAIIEINIRH